MKRTWIIVLVVVGVLALAGLGAVGIARAQESLLFRSAQQIMTWNDGEGPLHDYMMAAFAEALGLTPDALEARLESGESMYEIALAQGIAADKIAEVLQAARVKAIDAALADGAIDQQTADWMKSRGFGRAHDGAGPGAGYCDGRGRQYGPGMMRGGRW
jgi:hypothetical protein